MAARKKPKRQPKRPYGRIVAPTVVAPKSAEELKKLRAEALSGMADLIKDALGTLGDCLKHGPTRGQGSRSSDARYILDVVLDRIVEPAALPEDVEVDEEGKAAQTPIDELAERRAELQKHVRNQRREQERERKRGGS